MTKKVVKRKSEAKPIKEIATSYSLTQMYYDIDTVKMQMDMFSDSELFEYCLPHIEMYQHSEMDRLYNKVSVGKKLEKTERRSLEAFCILANTELCLSI